MAFPDELRGKKIVVLGAGKSGRAAAGLLARRDAHVVLADDNPNTLHPDELDDIVASHLQLVLGDVRADLIAGAGGIVVSPGVPVTRHPLIREARRAGVPVIGELELGSRFVTAPMAAVTGTNGKTTTANWIGYLIAKSGARAIVCGNVGTPICDVVGKAADWLSVEVSSYQLETIERFHPRVAEILNLTPDHLERHPTTEIYLAAKARIAENQTADDALVLNADDTAVWSLALKVQSTVWGFSLRRPLERGFFIENRNVVVRTAPGAPPRVLLRADEVGLPGEHNLANALASAAAAWLCGVSAEAIAEGLRDFAGVEHRIERVRERRGVWYINDSKATNLASLEVALRSFTQPIVLIAGGRGKGAPYEPLTDLVASTVRQLIVLGEDADRIERAWGPRVPTVRAGGMEEAVEQAARLARPGEVVLLSPACASFDMYRNFEERGRHFKDLVMRLEG
jgi:UDP-N-acetylmuramoylalanine--D-glutamate ligase